MNDLRLICYIEDWNAKLWHILAKVTSIFTFIWVRCYFADQIPKILRTFTKKKYETGRHLRFWDAAKSSKNKQKVMIIVVIPNLCWPKNQ